MEKSDLKNKLIEYQGGGFDGCFWEWNYAYFDKEGKFHDLFSSGRMGCKTEESMLSHLKNTKETEYDIYDCENEESLLQFTGKSSATNVIMVGRKMYEDFDIYLPVICEECGSKCDTHDASGTGIRWEGGLVYTNKKIICDSCYSLGICGECGEYVGEENLKELDDDGCSYCDSCLENLKEKEKDEEEK